jgi:hypothetical protein
MFGYSSAKTHQLPKHLRIKKTHYSTTIFIIQSIATLRIFYTKKTQFCSGKKGRWKKKSRLQVIDIRRLKEILDFFTLRTKQCPIKLPGRSLFVVVSRYPVFHKLKKDTCIFWGVVSALGDN